MTLSKKNKTYLIGALSIVSVLVLLLLIGEIVLPFIFAIFIAYLLNPIILKIQKKIKNRNLAISSFLFVVTVLFLGIVVFFGEHTIKDTKRLITAVEIFANENEQQIKDVKNSVVSLVDEVYDSEGVQNQIEASDTLSTEEKEQGLMSAIENVYSFFESPVENKDAPKLEAWSIFSMFIYMILYTIFILYTYDYFESKYVKYIGDKKLPNKKAEGIWNDFKVVFMNYFRQRAKVVLINIIIFITTFSIMDLPGAIIIGIVTGILSYASHFHYLSLPIVGIGCWILSMENDTSFFLYFGILLGVFILISILEETVYFSKIMKSVNGMNPAIMLLSFTLWISIFGGFTGTIIALPLTQLILIYVDRLANSKMSN